MTLLFNRVCRVQVDTLQVEGLRTSFKVVKTSGKTPNTAEVSIYNLAPSSRAGIAKKAARMVLEAGYESSVTRIFSGDARTVDHQHTPPDWVTKVTSGDGERAYQYARVSKSYAAGTSVRTVIREVAEAMGVDPGNLHDITKALGNVFGQGYVAHGQAARELDRLFAKHGYTWSIQDGRLQVSMPGQPVPKSNIVLSPSSGLLGAPEICTSEKKKGPPILKVRCLLQPALIAGGSFELRDTPHAGVWYISKLTHSGDTHGGDWFSDLEAASSLGLARLAAAPPVQASPEPLEPPP